jgi:BolA family transcriptional regulator, general stress-responsive regulator
MDFEASLKRKLIDAFHPQHLEITNESAHHALHPSSPKTGTSHFIVKMTSAAFKGKSALERHRLVYQVLEEELKTHIHALQLELDEIDD